MSAPKNQSRMTSGWLPAVAIAGVTWWACGRLIAPSLEREKDVQGAIADLREKLAGARNTIHEARILETEAAAVRWQIDRLEQEIPAGSAMIWLPEMVKKHFAGFGLNVGIVRMNTVRDEPDLPGYQRGYWSVGVPIEEANHHAAGALLAVAEFEQQHPFVRVLEFAIRRDPENPAGRIAVLNVAALIRK